MDLFDADLHIHSPHSIAVSKSLDLDTMYSTCSKKGLDILGTGDILQPEWLKYMKTHLEKDNDGSYKYKDIYFILQTEIEDSESVHQVVFFPDFNVVQEVQKKLEPYSKNILDEWGGRPRVNLSPPELVDLLTDLGCLIGPAHAFTPFRAIFRQKRFSSLEECYEDATKRISFLELGLSANTDLADRLDCLKEVSFLSNSDAHSQRPSSLGREFNRMLLDHPSFEEISLAINRKDSRKIELNLGLHPKLGKYYNMFCYKCRRRVLFKKSKKKINSIFNQYSITEDFIVYYSNTPFQARQDYIDKVAQEKIICPACKEEKEKNFKINLGVSERIDVISSYKKPKHPAHRPPYINAIPLIDIICAVKQIKTKTSKTVLKMYNELINKLGKEYDILVDVNIEQIRKVDKSIADIISAFRSNEITYTPGGGGTYGNINIQLDE
ncbi:MAG: hypothetical protein GF353_19110 [Candidatus Lokiarchaeota archaeon]|nr:hypothetical protein [Candidatus Lokiarchaeota archaeon]